MNWKAFSIMIWTAIFSPKLQESSDPVDECPALIKLELKRKESGNFYTLSTKPGFSNEIQCISSIKNITQALTSLYRLSKM
jgi:hypothetical protein